MKCSSPSSEKIILIPTLDSLSETFSSEFERINYL